MFHSTESGDLYTTLLSMVPTDAQCSETYAKSIFRFIFNFSFDKIFIVSFWDFIRYIYIFFDNFQQQNYFSSDFVEILFRYVSEDSQKTKNNC